ncbi:SDR family oxidoreductase [Curvivirga aplysinae]|uniref:SDR family oxidoreductase n=1 Tax=Curvivirga aplysinae TaxID=2529852 RepID=UPI0012BBFE93|nr:SDR family oxidoreductase [Curvivirga aplysinae]MTI11398.1 SDR family oxidoreductase [Curvivirga aplysinae]
MNFENKTALVTGAGGHLGRQLCYDLAKGGAHLILWDIAEVSDFAKELADQFAIKVLSESIDLSDEVSFSEALARGNELTGSLDILINNAAFVGSSNLSGWVVPFEEQSVSTWRQALEVNLTSTFALCQAAYPLLKRTEDASIVNVSSIYGILGPNNSLYEGTSMGNPAAYAASKGGLIQLTRWLSTSLAPEIRVNAVALGGIERGQPESFKNKYEKLTPMQRMGTEEDMSGPILFLASNMSKYITGQVLAVDGGWSSW